MQPESGQSPSNPYQFILEPPKPPRKSLLSFGGDSLVLKIAVLVGGAVFLMILVAVVFNLFFGGKNNIAALSSLAQTETEIIRIADDTDDVADQLVRNAAANTYSTVDSHRQLWVAYLAQKGYKMNDKTLALKTSVTTTKRLETAKESNTYDTTLTEVMRSQLTDYAAAIKDAYNTSSSSAEKTSLNNQYKDVRLLLEQWPK